MKSIAAVIALLALRQGMAFSITNCGDAGDIFSNGEFTVSETPFSLTATGTMTKAVTQGSLSTDLTVEALGGLVKLPLQGSSTFTFAPGVPAKDITFSLGPFDMPAIMSLAKITGQIVVSDEVGARVACVALDGSLQESVPEETQESVPTRLTGLMSCGEDSDHFKNPVISNDGQTLLFSGSLDEEVGAGKAMVDMSVVIMGTAEPFQVEVPFEVTPAMPQGDVQLTWTSDKQSPFIEGLPPLVQVEGNVKIQDGNSEQVSCFAVGSDEEIASVQV